MCQQDRGYLETAGLHYENCVGTSWIDFPLKACRLKELRDALRFEGKVGFAGADGRCSMTPTTPQGITAIQNEIFCALL